MNAKELLEARPPRVPGQRALELGPASREWRWRIEIGEVRYAVYESGLIFGHRDLQFDSYEHACLWLEMQHALGNDLHKAMEELHEAIHES